MKKRFKSHYRLRKRVLIFLVFIIITIVSFINSFKYFYKKIKINDTDLINYLMSNGANTTIAKYNLFDLNKLSSTEFLVKYAMGININDSIVADEDLKHQESLQGDYVLEQTNEEINNPIVYLYNTHQTEAYSRNFIEAYNIKPTVLWASYILKERLNDLGLPTIVEATNIMDILNANGWRYGKSYKISRSLMENAYKDNPSLIYFIDIHRDSGSYDKTTTTINGKKFAKVLFVVGVEYDNYAPNLKLANDLNDLFNRYYPNLSRGVLTKSGKGVNGIYNQDFNDTTMLIEIGGENNNIEEVNNTITAFSDILFKYIKGE